MKCTFKKNDILWAKLKGFPWWPGKINSIKSTSANQHTITIEFYGDKTTCVVPLSKIKPYQENFNLFSKSKRTTLQRAITLANKDIESSLAKQSTQEVKVNELAIINKIQNLLNNSIKNWSKEEIVFAIMNIINKLKNTTISPDILNLMIKLFFFLNKKKFNTLANKIKLLILREEDGNKNSKAIDPSLLVNMPNSVNNNTSNLFLLSCDKGDITDCCNNTNDKSDEMNENTTTNNNMSGKNQKENSIVSSTKSEYEEEHLSTLKLRVISDEDFILLLKSYFAFESVDDLLLKLNEMKRNNSIPKKRYLRKMISCRMNKTLLFLLNGSTVFSPGVIKQIVIEIEKKGRELDENMTFKYKLFIQEFYQKLKVSY